MSFDIFISSSSAHSVLNPTLSFFQVIFTGGTRSQQIKCWDVRARAPLYELATGNNTVGDIAWDAPRSTLYAQTECEYVDGLGRNSDYRKFRAAKDDQNDYSGRYWPSKAFHDENSFGYAWDCGDHALCELFLCFLVF